MTRTVQERAVVVGVDGSESADRAVLWGAAEAARRHMGLRLVTAFPWTLERGGHLPHGHAYRDELLHEREAHLQQAVLTAIGVAPGVEVEHLVVVGQPNAVLGAESYRAGVVVLGDRGHGALAGLLVGSTAVALAAGAGCPVVVVRGEDLVGVDLPVVVGIDGTPTSEDALEFAFEAASSMGVPLVAVHTWWVDLNLLPLLKELKASADTAAELLAERLAGWSEKYPDVTVERVLTRRPSAAEVLLAQAANAQLVVVGTGGRGALTGLVLGSVSQALLHHAPCPVAVVRPPR